MKAICVFSEGICYLKNHLINALNERNSRNDFSVQDILWILTVPAIWNDHAKQFMREAAEKVILQYNFIFYIFVNHCSRSTMAGYINYTILH